MSEFPNPDERRYEMRYVPIGELKPAEYNPRKISNDELDKLALSIQQNGFIDPVIANKDKTIIGGHQRVKAAQRLGIQQVPVIFVDLSKEQEKVLNLALNRIGGEFDEEMLANIIQELPRDMLDGTGFDQSEIEDMLSQALNPKDDNADVEPPVNPVSLPGEIYQLGDHVVMCGDSTKPEDVAKLMGKDRAEMVFTDPPYNVAYKGGMGADGDQHERQAIANDDMSPAQFREFLLKVMRNLMAYTDGCMYICMSSSELASLKSTYEEAGGHFQAFLIWVKNTFTLSRADFQNQYEPILYGWNGKVKNHYFVGWRDEGNVWQNLDTVRPNYDEERDVTTIQIGEMHLELDGEVTGRVIDKTGRTDIWREKKPTKSKEHPTMKPIPLVAKAIMASSTGGGIVLDLFGWSGSTLIACEETGRKCRTMELSPGYVDVIIARWERLTGKKAVKIA